MIDATDMTTPVTRGELREEIEQLEQRFDQKLTQFATKADLAQFATKADLAQFATKADLAQFATKADLAELAAKGRIDLEIWGGALAERLSKEIAGAAKAAHESHKSEISVIDDKYSDLPGRVSKLEATLPRKLR